MSRLFVVAYDLNDEPDDRDRQKIRDEIDGYCVQCSACRLSESCYYFSSEKSIETILSEISNFTDSNDVVSVVEVANIKTNSACVIHKQLETSLAELQSHLNVKQPSTKL